MMQTVQLWLFPSTDFALWKCACCDREEIADYDAYCELLDALARDAAAGGWECRLVRMGVPNMLAILRELRWENTSQNRARVLADPDSPAGNAVLGLQIATNAIGWALIGARRRSDERDAPTLPSVREVARLLFEKQGDGSGDTRQRTNS